MPASVPCPICGKPVSASDPNMPFCSDRCRTQDLANWASEKYVVPAGEGSNELGDEDGGEPRPSEGRGR